MIISQETKDEFTWDNDDSTWDNMMLNWHEMIKWSGYVPFMQWVRGWHGPCNGRLTYCQDNNSSHETNLKNGQVNIQEQKQQMLMIWAQKRSLSLFLFLPLSHPPLSLKYLTNRLKKILHSSKMRYELIRKYTWIYFLTVNSLNRLLNVR